MFQWMQTLRRAYDPDFDEMAFDHEHERLTMDATTGLTDAQKKFILNMLETSPVGRDDLPYSDHFERCHLDFVSKFGLNISIKMFWAYTITLAKKRRVRAK